MVIQFLRGSIYTTFHFLDASYKEMSSANNIIRQTTQARPEGYQYMPSYRSGKWDGIIRLCIGSRFPSGLLPVVIDNLRSEGCHNISVENQCADVLVDARGVCPGMFDIFELRPYQVLAARTLVSYGRGVARMATNSGKTAVIAAISKVVNGNVLVLTTKKDLLYQTADVLATMLKETVEVVGDGKWGTARVVVGMIQTLSRHMSRVQCDFGDVQAVIFDECHHIPSTTSQVVMFGLGAPLRFGFSGTPLRNDKLSDLVLIGATGPVIVDVTNADLIEQGISAEPVVHMYTISGDAAYGASWREAYDSQVVDNVWRNDVIVREVRNRKAKSSLILVDRLAHGESLYQDLADVFTFYVTGSSSIDDRQQALDMLRLGTGAIVIATPIFDEGVDVPAVELLVLAGGGKGHIKLLQRLGRGMRKKEGSNVLTVIDFVDDTNQYLLKHSKIRAQIYESEGFEVRIIDEQEAPTRVEG